jgi:hypothetical protein
MNLKTDCDIIIVAEMIQDFIRQSPHLEGWRALVWDNTPGRKEEEDARQIRVGEFPADHNGRDACVVLVEEYLNAIISWEPGPSVYPYGKTWVWFKASLDNPGWLDQFNKVVLRHVNSRRNPGFRAGCKCDIREPFDHLVRPPTHYGEIWGKI